MLRFLFVVIAPLLAEEWTPAHAMRFRDLGAVQVSPDGTLAIWLEREAVMAEEKSEFRSHVFLGKTDGSWRIQLTRGEKSAQAPVFSEDGKWVLFASDRNGKKNVYRIGIQGGEAEALTDWKGTMGDFALAPDGKHLAFAGREEDKDAEKRAKQKLDYKIVLDTPKNSTLWLVTLGGELPAKAAKLVDKPYHAGSFDWAPDSKSIAFVHTPRPDADSARYADIAEVEIATKALKEIASESVTETSPRYSPDGRFLAFSKSMGPNVLDADRVALLDRATGAVRLLAATANENPVLVGWAADSKSLFYSEPSGTRTGLQRLPIDGPAVAVRAEARGILGALSINATGTHFGFVRESPEEPREAYGWAPGKGEPVRVSAANTEVAKPPLGKTELIRWKSKDGREIEGLLTYPLQYKAGTRVPMLLNIHGGPSGVFSESFIGGAGLYPIAAFAQKGIAVLRANPRGSTGYGTAVRKMVVQDWGGRDFEDLMSGVDHVIAMGVADPERLAVMGWSYGGYMTAWTVTQTTRFKAAAVGAGITNHWSMYGTQDVPLLFEDYFGGPPWEHRAVYQKSSPIEHVDKVKTPTLILHGEQDNRVPVGQGYEYHRALKRRGVETKMVVYPRMPHGPVEPKFMQHIAEEHLAWAEKYLLR